MIQPPPLWKLNHPGTAVFRRLGGLFLKVYRRPNRAGFTCCVELRLDVHDLGEACALSEQIAAAFLEAHRAAA